MANGKKTKNPALQIKENLFMSDLSLFAFFSHNTCKNTMNSFVSTGCLSDKKTVKRKKKLKKKKKTFYLHYLWSSFQVTYYTATLKQLLDSQHITWTHRLKIQVNCVAQRPIHTTESTVSGYDCHWVRAKHREVC